MCSFHWQNGCAAHTTPCLDAPTSTASQLPQHVCSVCAAYLHVGPRICGRGGCIPRQQVLRERVCPGAADLGKGQAVRQAMPMSARILSTSGDPPIRSGHLECGVRTPSMGKRLGQQDDVLYCAVHREARYAGPRSTGTAHPAR